MLCCCWRCPQGFPKALATRIGTRAIPSSQCFFRPGNHPPKKWPKKSDLGNSYQPTYVMQISMLHPLQNKQTLLITMVSFGPLTGVVPFPNGFFMAYK